MLKLNVSRFIILFCLSFVFSFALACKKAEFTPSQKVVDPVVNPVVNPTDGIDEFGNPIIPGTIDPTNPNTTIDPTAGFPIDPTTGFPVNPTTGVPVNPNTGLPINPNTGLPINPQVMPTNCQNILSQSNGQVIQNLPQDCIGYFDTNFGGYPYPNYQPNTPNVQFPVIPGFPQYVINPQGTVDPNGGIFFNNTPDYGYPQGHSCPNINSNVGVGSTNCIDPCQSACVEICNPCDPCAVGPIRGFLGNVGSMLFGGVCQ